MTIKANTDGFLPKIVLGRCGERNARSIRFDIGDVMDLIPKIEAE